MNNTTLIHKARVYCEQRGARFTPLREKVYEILVSKHGPMGAYEKLDAEVGDMVGEVTNMICGSAKRDLAERGYEFGMATPIVVSGKQHTISHQVDGAKIILPFMCDEGLAHLEICFDK